MLRQLFPPRRFSSIQRPLSTVVSQIFPLSFTFSPFSSLSHSFKLPPLFASAMSYHYQCNSCGRSFNTDRSFRHHFNEPSGRLCLRVTPLMARVPTAPSNDSVIERGSLSFLSDLPLFNSSAPVSSTHISSLAEPPSSSSSAFPGHVSSAYNFGHSPNSPIEMIFLSLTTMYHHPTVMIFFLPDESFLPTTLTWWTTFHSIASLLSRSQLSITQTS